MVQVIRPEISLIFVLSPAFVFTPHFPFQTLCALVACLLEPQIVPSDPRELYETYFTFTCIWAFGGALHQDIKL